MNEENTLPPQAQQPAPETEPVNTAPTEAADNNTSEPEEPELDLDALIEEAEHRGYLRGRNEAIGQVKRRLAQWEVPRVAEPTPASSTPTILANLPTSIWDR
ncbi:MAG: hypothetical protein K2L93_06895 [Muribaculaceae bacterium]|nr:hypothetical protein [Muribaculaceae bacterium]MDE6322011.1 hypothetical protein [Muribaculaceae bacterium]